MKNLRTLIIVVLILTVILSVFVGCMNDKEEDIVTITHIALGKKLQNTDEIIDRVNERMRKEIGIEINVKFVPRSKYNSLYEGNEYFDSIFTAEHLDYWENVAEGYFAPISEKELREYAPNLSKISPDVFETGEYQGKTYAIPSSRTNYNMNCWVLRGDFMDKYGIKDIKNLDDIEAYLKAVKENETDIIPFNVCAEEAYCLLAAMTVNRGWENPGPSNAMSPVQISTVPGDENYLKLFNVLDTPEMLEFSERMKRWREMGFWPDTALETKVPACESILGGRSALAWMNLVDFEHIKKICNRDNRKNWDLRVFYTYSENPTVYSNMISATAISSKSTKKKDTLRMLDFLYSDKECSRLLHYGIEGENYELIDNKYRYIDNFEVGSPSYGISNYNFDYKPYFEDDYAEKLYDEISSGVGKDSNYSKIKSFAPKLSDFDKYNNSLKLINQEYTIPRILGFVDDPREAIRIEKEMYKAAGIDDYTVEVQNQLDAYIKEKGLK